MTHQQITMVADDGEYTVPRGHIAIVRGESKATITIERGGRCRTYDRSRPTIHHIVRGPR